MGTALGEPTGPSANPGVSLPAIGNKIAIGLIDIIKHHSTDFMTKKPLYWVDRKPAINPAGLPEDAVMSDVLIGQVLATQGACTGPQEAYVPVNVGDIVAIYCEKGDAIAWRDAKETLEGQPQTGYVVTQTFTHTEPAQGNDRKVRVMTIRPPKPEEAAMAAACEAAYQQRHSTPLGAAAAPAAQPQPAPAGDAGAFDAPAPVAQPVPAAVPAAQPAAQVAQAPAPAPQPAAVDPAVAAGIAAGTHNAAGEEYF